MLSANHFAKLGRWSCHLKDLRHLDLSWNAGLTSDTLQIILQATPGLKELHINGCQALSGGVFSDLPAGLKKLYATWIPVLNSAEVRSLLDNLKQLIHLDVSFSVPLAAGNEILAQEDAGHLRGRWICKNNVFTRRNL